MRDIYGIDSAPLALVQNKETTKWILKRQRREIY